MGDIKQILRAAGVRLINPGSVWLAPDIDPGLIAPGVVIHPGCRLAGSRTALAPGAEIGAEGPVTLVDCQLGEGVGFKSGFARQATLLDRAGIGANSHLRAGTLLEEWASVAHCVGLKQTILMPYVTLGSLINFCDCLMAGGTGLDNHSEVGSGYVHFNFTPRQDKATPSLIGDVPRGVLLDREPVFLGGQGGLVGPRRIEFGTVLAAGQVCRRDIDHPDCLVFEGGPGKSFRVPNRSRRPGAVGTIIENNRRYIGNLLALEAWYRGIRLPALGSSPAAWRKALFDGALTRLEEALRERLCRLGQMLDKLASLPGPGGEDDIVRLARGWPDLEKGIAGHARKLRDCPGRPAGLAPPSPPAAYLDWVRSLDREAKSAATAWLQQIVDSVRIGDQPG